MASAIWKGAVTFGLVNIPVQLYSAVRSEDGIHFRLLHATDHAPIKYERVCSADGEVVPWGDIVKGYEVAKGRYVVMTEEDFKAAAVESSRTLEILDFVEAAEVDPRYFETPYYLVPQKGGEKAYALLREAIRATEMVGIGTLTLRQRPHLVGLRVVGDALVCEIMRYTGEVVDEATFSFPDAAAVRPQEQQMAEQLVRSLAEPFDPTRYHDAYHDQLMAIIRAKMKGEKIEVTEPAEVEGTPVVDLMARLRESLERSKRGKGARVAIARPTGKAAPAERAPRKSARRTRTRKSA